MVLKPVDASGGYGLVIGPAATRAELDAVRSAVLASPRSWIAQPVVCLSTAPTLVDDGLVPRHVDLRPFAVNDGERVWVLPGGLTRVALPQGSLVVNSSQGGGSKDTWVLADGVRTLPREQAQTGTHRWAPVDQLTSIDPGPSQGQAQQQQQQRALPC
jgi:uncharacterized circularly permuted ATP-grasp superfamily protein